MKKQYIPLLIILVLLFNLIFVFLNFQLLIDVNNYEKQYLAILEKKEIISDINENQIGNFYLLHDPLYDKVVHLMAQNNLDSLKDTIQYVKNQGTKCAYAYVEVLRGYDPFVIELIGFDTADMGLVYFDHVDKNEVFVEIGEPFGEYYDIVIDIILIW